MVNGVADAGEVAAGVRTEIVPVVAPGGTTILSDVAVTFVGTPNTPPVKLTRSAPPSPVPETVTVAPTEPGTTRSAPSFAVGFTPVARKFPPLTVTTPPA